MEPPNDGNNFEGDPRWGLCKGVKIKFFHDRDYHPATGIKA